MDHVSAANRLHDHLASITEDLAPIDGYDGEIDEMRNPVLTEWVLVANVADLNSDDSRLVVLAAPTMLHSHVVGLLTMAERM